MGFSLNNLTLFGLVLAIGIVVDDAIVVLENVERMIATGLDARTATIKAMEEITGPILAITLALCSVFVPCCFLGGITGQFFRQFAVTIAVSTIISAVNALTMTPSRAVLIFKTERGASRRSRAQARGVALVDLRGGGRACWPTGTGRTTWPARFGLPAASSGAGETGATGWMSWAIAALYFIPGAVAGGVIGWLIIRPVNAVLGWLFRGFNRLFDVVTAWVQLDGRQAPANQPGRVAGLRGPGGADVPGLPARAHGLHSTAGPGPADRERPVARLGVAAAHPGGHEAGRPDHPRNAGSGPHA